MPDLKMSELPEDTTPEATDTLAGRRGSANLRATVAQYVAGVFGNGSTTGRLRRTGTAAFIVLVDKHDATTAPGTSNDNTEGYAVGSTWIDVTGDAEYVCVDASTGAAVWQARGAPTALTAASAPGTDNILVKTDGTGRAMQATGVSVDDSNNVTGLGTLNSARIPDGNGGVAAETGLTRSASSTDDNRVIECSNASGCTIAVNTGTVAGIVRAYYASGASQKVTLTKGTLTTLIVPASYDQGSSTVDSEETYAVVGVYYLTTSIGIAIGRMAAV